LALVLGCLKGLFLGALEQVEHFLPHLDLVAESVPPMAGRFWIPHFYSLLVKAAGDSAEVPVSTVVAARKRILLGLAYVAVLAFAGLPAPSHVVS